MSRFVCEIVVAPMSVFLFLGMRLWVFLFNLKPYCMKSKLILLVIVVVVIIGLLAYYQYVPFWVSIVSTGAFIFGVFLGWLAKGWSDKHVS